MRKESVGSRLALATLVIGTLTTGCTTYRETNTVRTPEEQMLLSKSVDYSLETAELSGLADRHVYVDATNLDCVDKAYVIDALKTKLAAGKARLVEKAGEADVVVTVRAAMLATQSGSSLIGLPSIKIPLSVAATTIETPEIALYKRATLEGLCKLCVTAYDSDTRACIDTREGAARTRFDRLSILFVFHKNRTNVPELKIPLNGKEE